MTRLIGAAALATGLVMGVASLGWAQQQQQQPQPQPQPSQSAESTLKVTPYGTIYFNFFNNDGGTNNGDVPLWSTAGTGSTSATARQTRLGLRVTGFEAAKAKGTAVVEIDFFGGFPAVGIGDNMGIVRLRLANVRLDWQHASVVIGQDWMVFAPANPTSIASASIPLMAAAGNPWARLPQLRGEWHDHNLLLQGAVMAPSTGDFNSSYAYQPTPGALSQVPFFQGRAAWATTNWRELKKPASIGVSGQYGRARQISTTADRTIDSRGVAVDWTLPIVSRLSLSGEAFSGRNLAGFQAGVFQGVNPDSAGDGGAQSIETRGGWAQVVGTINPRLNVMATYGLDDPRDESLASVSKHDWRVRNTAMAIGFIHKLSPQLSWGIEDRRFVTQFALTGRHTTNHINLAATFTF